MTQRRPDPGALPGWPRLLPLILAAAYCGCSPNSFEADVGKIWPEPLAGLRRKVWDRLGLDQAIDTIPGAAVQSPAKSLDETREARRAAYQSSRGKHGHKAA